MRRPVPLIGIALIAVACSSNGTGSATTAVPTSAAGTTSTSLAATTTTTSTTTVPVPPTASKLDTFFVTHGGRDAFGEVAVLAVTNYLLAEDAIRAGDLDTARALVDEVFGTYPPGSDRWWEPQWTVNGSHIGAPAAYYGLRMLDDVIDHLRQPPDVESHTVDLVVVLATCSEGVQARTEQDLIDGTGEQVTLALDERLDGNEAEWFDQATWAFRQYIPAITGGRLHLGLRIEHVEVCVPIQTRQFDIRVAGATDYTVVWDALEGSIVESGSWLWVLNPSAVPAAPDIADLEYITGGMGRHPSGAPAFLSDDLWVVRKPPHLGDGEWSDVERRAYMPQWLMHEFYHHLFWEYPEYGLEAEGHQWFDRSTWPGDFAGQFETDYYVEALHRRLMDATPPLHVGLRYDAPSSEDFAEIEASDLVGIYRREPVENEWHVGVLTQVGDGFVWRNDAGVEWSLGWEPGSDRLLVGPDGVYDDASGGDAFVIVLERDTTGGFGDITGFRFLGEVYLKG